MNSMKLPVEIPAEIFWGEDFHRFSALNAGEFMSPNFVKNVFSHSIFEAHIFSTFTETVGFPMLTNFKSFRFIS